jgi:hypothetical protein
MAESCQLSFRFPLDYPNCAVWDTIQSNKKSGGRGDKVHGSNFYLVPKSHNSYFLIPEFGTFIL